MLLQKLRARMSARLKGEKGEAGFTLIELLVVMLILGILAAIAIPAFFNQRDKGTDAQAKAAVRTAQTAIETYATDNGGKYGTATVKPTATTLAAIEPTIEDTAGEDNAITVNTAEGDQYKVSALSGTGYSFSIERSGGTVTFDCTEKVTGKGGCPVGGDWSQ